MTIGAHSIYLNTTKRSIRRTYGSVTTHGRAAGRGDRERDTVTRDDDDDDGGRRRAIDDGTRGWGVHVLAQGARRERDDGVPSPTSRAREDGDG